MKILIWGRCVQKLSQRSSPKKKSKEESQFAKTFWRGKMTFWAVSSKVMKHGSTNTTLKWSGKMHNGRLPIPHDQKVPSVQINSQNNVADFFSYWGIVHYEFVPTGQTVNQVYYLEILERLCDKVRRKRPELFASNWWILHHDTAPAHTALSVREFLATKQISVLEHPAYSPDLAPNDCSPR